MLTAIYENVNIYGNQKKGVCNRTMKHTFRLPEVTERHTQKRDTDGEKGMRTRFPKQRRESD